MNKIPITFALMTTTKGHFGIKTRYKETIQSFNSVLPLSEYSQILAHIKNSKETEVLNEMIKFLRMRNFDVHVTDGEWSHHNESHQLNYLQDLYRVAFLTKNQYIMIIEDDWLINVDDKNLTNHLCDAIKLLEDNPAIVQVRIPRWYNEADRINNLKVKHNLDRKSLKINEKFFIHNDYSANPSIYRTRDLINALTLTLRNSALPKHVEHGLGEAFKILNYSIFPFACFNPDNVRIGHIGTPIGHEDDVSKKNIAN